ncbi:MAG: shikimate kinase, partial [Acidobacteriota bacterium]
MNDYYSHHPLVSLDRHVVLAGFVTEETRGIGYRLAALTGLPVTDLDRSIEHVAGQSVWKLIWNEGEARYRELERVALRRALDDRPLGIITLGDGTLL